MALTIHEYLERAVQDFAIHLEAHPTKESYFTRGVKLEGAKLFVMFLLGKPLPNPFADRK